MKSAIAAFALTSALVAPGLAAARPVTFTTTLNNYGGDGAYLALYLTDASGAYAGTLWMAGGKSKYYDSLAGWYRAEGTGLESNLLQSNLLILIYLCIASPAALLAHPRPTYVAKTTII